MDKEKYILTTPDVAKIMGTTKAAVYQQIRSNRLKAIQDKKGRWHYNIADVRESLKTRHSRLKSRINGQLIFDPEKGEYNVQEASRMLGEQTHRVYYFLRTNQLPFIKKRSAYVIHIDDIKKFKERKAQSSKLILTKG